MEILYCTIFFICCNPFLILLKALPVARRFRETISTLHCLLVYFIDRLQVRYFQMPFNCFLNHNLPEIVWSSSGAGVFAPTCCLCGSYQECRVPYSSSDIRSKVKVKVCCPIPVASPVHVGSHGNNSSSGDGCCIA